MKKESFKNEKVMTEVDRQKDQKNTRIVCNWSLFAVSRLLM